MLDHTRSGKKVVILVNVCRVTILDVNDQPPVFHPLPESCVVVTEFHELGETVYSLKASDADDPNTPNGWVNFSILGGNDQGIYFSGWQ